MKAFSFSRRTVKFYVILLCCTLTLFGCKKTIDKILAEVTLTREQTIFELDKAINVLQNAPGDWERVLTGLEEKLVGDIQTTIREDLNITTNKLIGEAQTSILCIIDAIPSRALRALHRIRGEFLDGVSTMLIEPVICQTSHNTIDLSISPESRKEIIFYGYDFEKRDSFAAFFVSNTQEIELLNKIHFQSNYEFTLDLAGLANTYLSDFSYISIRYNNMELSSFSIQEDDTAPIVETIYRTPSSFGFIPPHTRGDREYKGHGPNVYIDARLYTTRKQVYLKLYMNAVETKSDWTTAQGYSPKHFIYTAPEGFHIKRIEGETYFPNLVSYRDDDTSDENFSTTLGLATVTGDTGGDDAGVDTGVKFNFSNQIAIVIEEGN